MLRERPFDYIGDVADTTNTPNPEPAFNDPALQQVAAWATEQAQREAARARLIADINRRQISEREAGHKTPGWYAATTHTSLAHANAVVTTSIRLVHEFPALLQALEHARITWQHAEAFVRAANPRIAHLLAELTPELVDLAQVATFRRWTRELRGIANQLDQDGGYNPNNDPAANRLYIGTLDDGTTEIRATLHGELALIVKSVLTAHTDHLRRRYQTDHDTTNGDIDIPDTAQLAAEALADLLDTRTTADNTDRPVIEPEVVVLYNPDTDTATDTDGNSLDPAAIRWVLAAGFIRLFEITEDRDVLRMGKLNRYANTHQRKALLVRDGGCIFPGCTRHANRCDAHHVDHHTPDPNDPAGPTDIENLGLLCRHHHRITHRPGWLMERWTDPNSPTAILFRWRTPTGRTIYSQRHGVTWIPKAA